MKKELGEAPLHIEGWLIPVAVSLLVILNSSLHAFIRMIMDVILYFALPGNQGNDPQFILLAMFCILALPLSVYCTIMFFDRRKNFKIPFVVLQTIYIAYISLLKLNFGLPDISAGIGSLHFRNYFEIILSFLIGILLSIYLFISRRVKNTFIFTEQINMPENTGLPLHIQGLFILIALQTSVLLNSSFFSLINIPSDMHPNDGWLAWNIIKSAATLCLSIWAIIAFFKRKKIFRLVFFVLMVFYVIRKYYAMIVSLSQLSSFSNESIAIPLYLYIPSAIGYLYPLALMIYIFVSRRVKNTFVYQTRINFKGIIPALKQASQYGLPDENLFTEDLKQQVDNAILTCKVQPIGNGYVDLVTIKDYILPFIEAMQKLNVRIRAVSWWRFSEWKNESPKNKEAWKSRYFKGSFSEMLLPIKEFKKDAGYDAVIKYIQEDFPKSKDFSPCLIPGFWLEVPDGWRYSQ